MKYIIIPILLLGNCLQSLTAVEVTRHGPNTTDKEAERIQEDYLQVRSHAIEEYMETGEVGRHSYRSLSMQISFAEARGYRIEPQLRVTEMNNIGAALLMQIMEEQPRQFSYLSIYKIRP